MLHLWSLKFEIIHLTYQEIDLFVRMLRERVEWMANMRSYPKKWQ